MHGVRQRGGPLAVAIVVSACHVGRESRVNEPVHIGQIMREWIARRGIANRGGLEELRQVWAEAVGERMAGQTRVLKLRHGVLHVTVGNAPLLSELAAFHKPRLLRTIRERVPAVRDIRFQLRGV